MATTRTTTKRATAKKATTAAVRARTGRKATTATEAAQKRQGGRKAPAKAAPAKRPTARRKPAKARPTGRPLLLTEQTMGTIESAIRQGAGIRLAAASVGISDRALYLWMARGRAEADRLEDAAERGVDADPTPDAEVPYLQLFQTITRARGEAHVIVSTRLRMAINEGDSRAATWWLERTDPGEFGRRETVELTGASGGPVQVDHRFTPDEIGAELQALLELPGAEGLRRALGMGADTIEGEVVEAAG